MHIKLKNITYALPHSFLNLSLTSYIYDLLFIFILYINKNLETKKSVAITTYRSVVTWQNALVNKWKINTKIDLS